MDRKTARKTASQTRSHISGVPQPGPESTFRPALSRGSILKTFLNVDVQVKQPQGAEILNNHAKEKGKHLLSTSC